MATLPTFLYILLFIVPIKCPRSESPAKTVKLPSKCDILGVHPHACDQYKSDSTFVCGAGSGHERRIPAKYVNDNYCDCVGTGDDEPGTSACSNGKFWCKNVGYSGRFVYSSRVNDGICDCCDGSDEAQNDRVQCPNVCKEKAAEELKEIIGQKQKYVEGIKVKNSLIPIAKAKLEEKRKHKKEIEIELKQKRHDLKRREELKVEAEAKEKAYTEDKRQREEEEKRQKEEEDRLKEEERRIRCEQEGNEDNDDCDEYKKEKKEKEEKEEKEKEEPVVEIAEEEEVEEEIEETPRERRRRLRRERHEERTRRNKERAERRQKAKEEAREERRRKKEEAKQAAYGISNPEEKQKENVEMEETAKEIEHTPDEEFPYPEQYRPHDEQEEVTETKADDAVEHTPDEEFPYPEQYRPHEEGVERKENSEANVDDDDYDDMEGFDWSAFDEDDDLDEEMRMMDGEEVEEVDTVGDELKKDDEERGLFGSIIDGVTNGVQSVKNMIFGDDDDYSDGHSSSRSRNPYSKEAREAKSAYNAMNREIRDLEKDLEAAEKVLEMDFGEKNVFAALFDECYSKEIGKYEYEFCPFGEAKQKEGSSSTKLGKFKEFGYSDGRELTMLFDEGQKCWNGPKRSLSITFRCAADNEIVYVNEPSTCKYVMTFETPLACDQAELDRYTDLIDNKFKTEL